MAIFSHKPIYKLVKTGMRHLEVKGWRKRKICIIKNEHPVGSLLV